MQNLNQNEQIKCPSCGSFIDISTALYAQILDKAKQEMLKQKKNLMMRSMPKEPNTPKLLMT